VDASNQCKGEAFVAKLNAAGSAFVYSTYLGGSGGDSGNAIAVDANGDAYVAGETQSSDFPLQIPLQSTLKGNSDAFVAKLLPSGSQLAYSTYLGGSSNDLANAIAVDAHGSAFVSGHTISADFPTQSPVQAACSPDATGSACSQDAFLAIVNPSGESLRFSTYIGGTGADDGRGVALGSNGAAYLGGSTTSANFPMASPAIASASAVSPTPALQKANALAPGQASNSGPAGGIVAMLSGMGSDPQQACTGSINWNGQAGDNQWTTVTNWDKGVLPVATDSVCIPTAFATTTITIGSISSSTNQTVASLVSNANINFTTGPLTVTGGATFVNALAISGGTLTLNGTSGSSVGTTMSQTGGTLAGTDTLDVTGLFTWTGGSMCTAVSSGSCVAPSGAQGITNANGGMSSASGVQYLYGRTLNNGGTATISSQNYMYLYYGAVVNNLAGATWNLSSDYNMYVSTGGGTFNNAGTFEKTGGTTTSAIEVTFNNTGSVLANTATLSFQAAGNSSGSWSAAPGATLGIGSASGVTSGLSGAISGAGTVQLGYSGTINLTGSFNVTGTTTAVNGVENFTAPVTSLGTLIVNGGILSFSQAAGCL
jgi:hypothetical protein